MGSDAGGRHGPRSDARLARGASPGRGGAGSPQRVRRRSRLHRVGDAADGGRGRSGAGAERDRRRRRPGGCRDAAKISHDTRWTLPASGEDESLRVWWRL
ncbi:hypothetical protein HMPREF0569_0325 [Micrococcus luteus SK58]|nr:hypothetical protein HMPREF0569_0325 [Micrococcus luteus SK58]